MAKCEIRTKSLKPSFGRDETPRSEEEVLGAFIFMTIFNLSRKKVI
tara:strand:+ start:568 stop:705 length:138 start_codon:yes stop_codon:yes gene_type:complete